MRTWDLDIVVTRGPAVESHHRVHAAVVDASGALVGSARDPGVVTAWRSCAKPFQVMPLIESGGFDELGWGDDELAIACASHGGEPEHLAIAAAMLERVGLEEGDLACGPHEPLSPRGLRLLRDTGARPTRLHNNCSGKHAAMLARAAVDSWETTGYEREGHPVQEAILERVAAWTGVPAERVGRAVDGCGAVVFGLSLDAMARSYARLADAAERGDEVPERIVHAMTSRPFLVGGTERFDSLLMEETGGRVLAKVGAEGVHTVAVLDQRLGFAIKVEDGNSRAQHPAVLRMLQHLGALPDPLPPRLADLLVRAVRNTRGETVGEVRPAA
jgi:L-asparaginase II